MEKDLLNNVIVSTAILRVCTWLKKEAIEEKNVTRKKGSKKNKTKTNKLATSLAIRFDRVLLVSS